jgi:hypothetical protein
MPETFMTPEIVGHFLAGLQFMLGDLAADATPNPASRGVVLQNDGSIAWQGPDI